MERRYPKRRPTLIDLFCGAGGMSVGFEQAGFDIVLGVDRDGHHVATHERNFPYGKSVCASVSDLDGKTLLRLAGIDEVDVVVGGPPCQGFSNMGLRDVSDPRNTLVAEYARLLLELKPKAFLMENVPGMIAGSTKAVLDDFIARMEKGRYTITTPVRILNAADFGVPQDRKRVFVIGIRRDIGGAIPYPNGILPGQPPRPTVWDAIEDLPDLESHDELFKQDFTTYNKKPRSLYAKVARGLVVDPSDLSRPREWNKRECTGCLRIRHADTSVKLYDATPAGETVPGHKLPRLDPHGIAPTLRAGSDSTHGSYTAPRPIHPKLPRCITSREAARLHGFPDWFGFYPLKWHAYRQIGNAVCPPIARAIGTSIRQALVDTYTSKTPPAETLLDDFVLPDDRPRTLKRIPLMAQFPPVVQWLFENAIDKKTKRLRKPHFSFADVEKAIDETGVNLHWIRPDTFLSEIARSRRLSDILRPVHDAGFSIKAVQNGKTIGAFVPFESEGSIEDKDTLQVRIEEIHGAVSLKLPKQRKHNLFALMLAIANHTTFIRALLGTKKQVRIDGANSAASRVKRKQSFLVVHTTSPHPKAIASLLLCETRTMPTRTQLARIAHRDTSDNVVVLVAATKRHYVAMRFVECQSYPKETVRLAFDISN